MARITWQTLIGPSLADAARPMESAARMLDNAFGGAMKVVDDQAMQLKTEKVKADEGRVQAYMDAVQGAGSVEALDALRKSGRLGELRAAILNPENAARVRGLEDRRTTELQQAWTANQAFNDRLATEAERPLLAEFNSVLQSNDLDAAEGWIAANGTKLRDSSVLMKALNDARTAADKKQVEAFDRNMKAAVDSQNLLRLQADRELDPLRKRQLETQIQAQSDAAAAARTARQRDEAALAQAAAAAQAQANLQMLKDLGNPLAVSGVFDPSNTAAFMDEARKSGADWNPDEAAAVAKVLGDLRGYTVGYMKPGTNEVVQEQVPLSNSLVRQALLSTQTPMSGWLGFNDDGFANEFKKNLQAALNKTREVRAKGPDGKERVYQIPVSVTEAEDYFGAALTRAQNPGPGTTRKR